MVGVEVSSAIKNIYSMIIGAGQSLNSSSNLFQKSILEMKYLIKHFKGKDETISGLAGVGDLYVSAAGGRNSKMGSYLGKGFTFKQAKKKFKLRDENDCVITEIDKDKRRVAISHRLTQENPYETFEPGNKQGSTQRDPRKIIGASIRELAMGILGRQPTTIRRQ